MFNETYKAQAFLMALDENIMNKKRVFHEFIEIAIQLMCRSRKDI